MIGTRRPRWGARSGSPGLVVAAALAVGAVSALGAVPPALGAQEPAPAAAAAASLPEGVSRGPSVEGITEYRLDNGLRVLLFPDPSKERTTVNVTYFVGSRHEAYGETGMAHLLEHLVFKGTPDHPDIPQELTERGALPNGTTWFDRTNYFETFPASDDNLEWALDLEADRMVNSFIAKEDLDSEMTVVRNEWEAGENSPFGVLLKRTMSAAFQWHNYGNSTIGARADIENVPIERLQAFYRKYYQPDNAILIVAGKFEEARALELIAEKFGAIPAPERTGATKIWDTYTAEPAQDGERTVALRRVGDVQIALAIYHVPAGSHADYAAVDVLGRVLGAEPAGRLYKRLVETGKAAEVTAFDFQLEEPGALILAAEVRREDSLEEAREALVEAIESVISEPPTEEEVERARNELLRNIELSFRNTERIALGLSEWAAMGDWRLFFLHRDRLEGVTPEDVHRVAEAYLNPSNRTLGLFHPVEERPARAEIPPPPDVEKLVADYRGREAVAAGEAFDPTPANVEARVTRLAFPSGFELAMLPKENRGETVNAAVHLRFGSEEALVGAEPAAELAGAMLMRGTTERSRQELRDELDRLRAQVFVSGDATSGTVRIETVRENLPAVLRVVGEVLRSPAFDEAEWALLKEERLASLESQMSEPTARGSRAFNRHLNPWPEDHPEYTPTYEEEIERIGAARLERAEGFYRDFWGAAGGTMAIVGDFDPAEIRPILEEVFGDWEAARPYVRFDRPAFQVEPTAIEIETPDKTNALLLAGLVFPMRDAHPDYPALVLGNYMLGGGFLNSRLATRIRQEEGLSYGVGSNFNAHPLDERAGWTAYAIFAPENADRVEEALRDELRRALEEGFTEEELEAAKRGWQQFNQNLRGRDGNLANDLSGALFFDRTLAWDAELEAKVAALTSEEVAEAMRRHLDLERLVVVRAGDFAGAEERAADTGEADGDPGAEPGPDGEGAGGDDGARR